MFRITLGVVLVVGAALGWLVAAGPSIVLGSIKEDYVAGAEAGGIDMSECKARQKTILDPSGGMAMCAQDVYRGIQSQLDEAARNEPAYVEPGGGDDSAATQEELGLE